jgi:phage tail sheath protein FI
MAFQLSPGVQVTEKDLTSIVPAVGTSIGGYAGDFAWGPCNEIRTISSENNLVKFFGKPPATGFEGWFSVASFLAYTNNCKVIRAIDTSAALNATSDGTGILITNEDDYENNHEAGSNSKGMWAAKWPGVVGGNLKVSFADSTGDGTATYDNWAYAGQFDFAPGTTEYAANNGATEDEFHIIVIDEDGYFTGQAGTVLEKFAGVSKAADAKDSVGRSNYYKTVINNRSEYIWWLDHPALATTWGDNTIGGTTFAAGHTQAEAVDSLSGGANGTTAAADVVTALDLLQNDELVDVNLIFAGNNAAAAKTKIQTICTTRLDCIGFVSPPSAAVLDNIGSEAGDIVTDANTYTRSSYMVYDSGWKYTFDRYYDRYVYVPCNGDVAGLCANTDFVADPWFSPAGFNRGKLKNALKLAYTPNKADRDTLYTKGVNPIIAAQGSGITLFGDKTMLDKPSAFDRINVRRLFIVLEKAIATAAKFQLFEFNDAFTRAQFRNLVEPFLRDVQGRRGIYDFRVICDETNNTGQVIDSNGFVADIFIKPARSINFIQLNFIATRTGITFEELIG